MRTVDRPDPRCRLPVAAVGCGCGSSDDSTPVACLEGPNAYLSGARSRAGRGRARRRDADQRVPGPEPDRRATSPTSAARWSKRRPAERQARAEPGGAANLQLGYLLGAAERGAEETEGHPRRAGPPPHRRRPLQPRQPPAAAPRFLRAYGEGFDAGARAAASGLSTGETITRRPSARR